jgi:hypothetical protein
MFESLQAQLRRRMRAVRLNISVNNAGVLVEGFLIDVMVPFHRARALGHAVAGDTWPAWTSTAP